jgi:3-hydroxyisobutyrate dehydrogenase
MKMATLEQTETIGFIGLGVMGGAMVHRLLDAGCKVTIYSRRKASAEPFVNAGASWIGSKDQLAANSNKIFTIVGGPSDVRELYLGKGGLIANSRPGTILIDMTTSSSDLARSLYDEALINDVHILDAPVTGGAPGAESGELTIMAGGDETALEAVRPELNIIASQIVLMGSAGAGQTTKMCNQLAVSGIMMGMAEALSSAKNSDIDPKRILQVLQTGTASSVLLERIGPKMLNGDNLASFYVSHFIKDLTIAIQSAGRSGQTLPGALLCRQMYEVVAENGGQNKGIQALLDYYIKQKPSSPLK